MDRSSLEVRARIGRWLLAMTILVSAMALGALHTPVLALCAVLAALSCAFTWYGASPLRARPAAAALVAVAVLLIVWTAIQALPLPHAVLATLARENADVWSRALAPFREKGPDFASISLDPVATRVEVLRGVTYLLIFLSALRVAQRPEGLAFVLRALVVASLAMAAAALVHPAFGVHKVFGAYEPGEAYAYSPRHIAPLLNTNHLAAYLNIGLFVALDAALLRRQTMPRPVALAAVVILLGTNLWAGSRGGTASMIVGFALTLALGFGTREARRMKLASHAVALMTTAGAVLIIVLSASESTRDELSQTDLSKLKLFMSSAKLLSSYGLFGIGRGAFQSVFPSVRTTEGGPTYLVFTHPENILAQWFTEWGLPIAILAFATIAWALRPKNVLARSQPPIGAWAAIAAVGLHNLVDFNSEVPGVMIALSVCAASIVGGTGGSKSGLRVETWSSRPKRLAGAGMAVALVGSALTLPFVRGELYNEQRFFLERAVDRSLPKAAFLADLRGAMLRHPAEPYFPFIGALRATLAHDESVVPWAAHTLERSPVHGRTHLLLARAFYARSPSQARLEYRYAAHQDSGLVEIVVGEAARLVTDYDDAMELVQSPEEAATEPPATADTDVHVLELLAQTLTTKLPSTAVRIDEEIVRRSPTTLSPSRRAAAAALQDVQNKEPWCVDAKSICLSEALAHATRIRDALPMSCEGHALIAQLRIAAGQVEAGLEAMDQAVRVVKDRSVCARQAAVLAVRSGKPAQMDVAIERLVRGGCETDEDCVENLVTAATLESDRGNTRRSLNFYKRAIERAPDRYDLLATLGGVAASHGLHGDALDAYTKLAQHAPGESQWAQAAAREKEALLARPILP